MSKTHTDIILLLYSWILIIYPSITFKYKPVLFKYFLCNGDWFTHVNFSGQSTAELQIVITMLFCNAINLTSIRTTIPMVIEYIYPVPY